LQKKQKKKTAHKTDEAQPCIDRAGGRRFSIFSADIALHADLRRRKGWAAQAKL
jgi:hypothetical protein